MSFFSKLVQSIAVSKQSIVQREELEQIQVKSKFSDVILYSKVDWRCRYTVIAFSAVLKYSDQTWLNEAFENIHAVDQLRSNVLPKIVHWAYNHLFIEKEDTYLVQSDFKNQAEISDVFFKVLQSLFSFKHTCRSNIIEILQPSLPEVILFLCAHWKCYNEGSEQKEKIYFDYWTSENTLSLASDLLGEILDLLSCENISCLLLKHSCCSLDLEENTVPGKCKILSKQDESQPVSYFHVIMDKMRPHLTRSSWSRNHVMKYVFKIILLQLHSPHVSEFLQYLLPPALLFLDHHVTANKILGVECLLHIMRNCSKEELRWYGRADVLYEAIKQQLYTNEIELIKVTHPAMLTILEITEKNVCKVQVGDKRCSNRYDDVLRMILLSIEGENRIDLRRVMTEHLWVFIERMGITVLKHMKQLINVITTYLEVYDGPEEICRFNILKALQQLIKVSWPRIFRFEQILLKSLLKFVYDISCETSSTPTDITDRLTDEVMKCLVLLKLASRSEMETLLKALKQTSELKVCHDLIDNVLKASVPD